MLKSGWTDVSEGSMLIKSINRVGVLFIIIITFLKWILNFSQKNGMVAMI